MLYLCRKFLLIGFVVLLGDAEGLVFGQAGASNDSNPDSAFLAEYNQARSEQQKSLQQLADRCAQLKKEPLARFTRSWIYQRDPSREYYFPILRDEAIQYPTLTDQTDKFWRHNFGKVNKKFAGQLLVLATKANANKKYELSYRLLHECLFYDPTNQSAQSILGEDFSEKTVKANAYRRKDALLPNGTITKYETANFVLFTSIDKKLAEKAIAKFERWHVIWRQAFYTYWAHSSWLSRRFEKDVKPVRRSKKFKVILYKNREEYIEKLKPLNQGIEVSVGYYLFPEKTSFFYYEDSQSETTWIHELTHQFMHETIPVSTKSSLKSSIWAVEGIAIYMESLVDFGRYLTVGGLDAERLHFCRHNYFRRGFFVPMSSLNPMTQAEFVQHEDVKGLYSLSGAYCHFVMANPKVKKEFFKFLQLVHQGKNSNVLFERISEQIAFDKEFKLFLMPSKTALERSLLNVKNYKILYLGISDVDDQTIELLRDATKLESLDLSGTAVTDKGLKALEKMNRLKYLSLERTKIGDGAMSTVGKLQSLEEIDLTTTGVTDIGLKEINGFDKLIALWIAGTRVSDASLDLINGLKGLKQLDIRKSAISESGGKRLNPRLKLVN